MDVYTAVQAYLDQDAQDTLTPEVEVTKPEYKVFVSFKKENVRLCKIEPKPNNYYVGCTSL